MAEEKKAPEKKKKAPEAYKPVMKSCAKCGSRMAVHSNRFTCGKCGYTEFRTQKG
jgi:ribosomal protein S27AE